MVFRFLFAFILLFSSTSLLSAPPFRVIHENEIESYLLPSNHPLKTYLKIIFRNPNMFNSAKHFEGEGFAVIRGHRKLMVGSYPSLPLYLYKKFPNIMPQSRQLENFVKRIRGAETIRRMIEKYQFKHMVVPQKWLYKLPRSFSNEGPSYLLVVENMNIYGDWRDPNGELKQLYYHMDVEVLTELCTLLHALGGCDAFPRNQPFTRDGKIAFVDTEHVGQMKGHYLKHIVPALREEIQPYAIALWNHLEEEAGK